MKTTQAGAVALLAAVVVLLCAPAGAAVVTSLVVTSNSNPSQLGEYVTFTATVAGGAVPTGTVTFRFNGVAAALPLTLTPLAGNVSTATWVASALTLGNRSVTFAYGGNLTGTNVSPVLTQAVINTRTTTTATVLNVSVSPLIAQGQLVTFTATMTKVPASPPPAGVVNFYTEDPLGFLTLIASRATNTSPGGVTTANFSTTSLPLGSSRVFANFIANAPLRMSSANRSVTVVSPATTPTLTITPPAGTVGDTLTFTAKVTSALGTPTGTVRFIINGSNYGPFSLNASGNASVLVPFLSAGNLSARFTYTATGLFQSSNSSTSYFLINAAGSSTGLTSSQNPSFTGATVTFTAAVTSAYPGTPSGTMTFLADGLPICSSVPLSSGSAQCATSSLATGVRSIQAQYSGSSIHAASSGVLSQNVVGPSTSTLTITPTSGTVGSTLTFNAKVTSSAGTPTGTVLFTINGSNYGPHPLNAFGNVSIPVTFLTAGNLSASFAYTPTGIFQPGTSSTKFFLITGAASATSLSTSANPSLVGAPVTFTATVTSGYPGIPSGTMDFLADSVPVCAAVPLSSGSAQCTTSALALGVNFIEAQYSGSSVYLASSNSRLQNLVAATVTVTSNANPSEKGQFVTFTASVEGANPTGVVTFQMNGTTYTPPLSLTPSGANLSTATWVAPGLAVGTALIAADYVGNLGAFSGNLSQNTLDTRFLPTNNVVFATPSPATVGETVTFSAYLFGSGSPRGDVTFYRQGDFGLLTAVAFYGNVSSANYQTSSLPPGTTKMFVNFVSDYPYRVTTGNVSVTVLKPEMNVVGNGSVTILDGDASPTLADHTDFGSSPIGSPVTRTYTIQNFDSGNLLLTGSPAVVVSGANAADFVVTAQPSSPVGPFGSNTFQVTFTPGAAGTRLATLSIDNNDLDESPYDFSIQGTGVFVCPTITPGSLLNGTDGVPYTGSVGASGGVPPYTYVITSGSLPPGLGLTSSGAGAGDLAGTPSATGTFPFQIKATDSNGCTGVQPYIVHMGSLINPGDLIVHEFRARGPVSATDEYIEITNRTSAALTVAATDGSAGFGIAAQNAGVCPAGSTQLLVAIPNGTTIPAGGSYLAAHDTDYSLSGYGGALAASPDGTWPVDLCDGSGVGLFRSATTLTGGTTLDAVGFAAGSSSPYLEGTGLLAPAGVITAPGQHAFRRKESFPTGLIKDTGSNAADFHFVSPDAAIYSSVQSSLGAPGPQNLASPFRATLLVTLADPAVSENAAPNRVQIGNNHYFRRLVTNNTGTAVTMLRVRVADLSTLFGDGYNPATQADVRVITTPDAGITLTDTTTPTAIGMVLEAPSVPFSALGKGGGYNASLVVNLPGPLADGASVYVNIGMRSVKGGPAYFFFATEIQH